MGYVYKITHIESQKSYIGISINNPERGRIRKHLTGHGSVYLGRAIKKYGQDAFDVEILEENVFNELLPDLEIAYIEKYNTLRPNGFNLTEGGLGIVGFRHTDETKQKISKTMKGRPSNTKGKKFGSPSDSTRRKISEAQKGKKHHAFGKKLSFEHRQKISQGLKGKTTGRKLTEEHRKKLSDAKQGHIPWNKGKSFSEKARQNMSKARKGKPLFRKRHPERHDVQNVYTALPLEMSLTQKRQFLFANFPSIDKGTIRRWTNKWQSETD